MNIHLLKKNIQDSYLFRLLVRRSFTLSNKQIGYILTLSGFAFTILFISITLYLPTNDKDYETVSFAVQKGEGVYQIATHLEEQDLIRSRVMFTLYAFIKGNFPKLQTGEYLLSASMDAHEILGKFATGDIVQDTITITEGWDLRDIAEAFEKRGLFPQEEFFAVTGYPAADYREDTDLPKPKDFSGEFPVLKDKPDYVSLEGYLFPDTYQITANETPESFVRRALKNFQAHLAPDILEQIQEQKKTVFEVVNFAAMVEKEVRTYKDKQTVAGILQKRIDNHMRLQTDAPVVYVREGNYYKVSIDETRTDSPYNTYVVYGLPLGPISNPGLESIKAVLNPTDSPYWFYLSARDGTTIFSRNFEEHLAAKARYLR